MENPIAESSPSQPRRSCLTCAAAKVKCVQSDENAASPSNKCDRCQRLNKACVLQAAAVRKQRTRKKKTRVAHLEEKLDGLVQLLTSKENPHAYPSPESVTKVAQSPANPGPSRANDDYAPHHQPYSLHSQGAGAIFTTLSPEECQEYVDIFRAELTPQFPFVVIPAAVSTERLRLEKPALFAAVVVAASYNDFPQHVQYGEHLLQYLTEWIIIKGEKSLDLLQALLVYTVWYRVVNHFRNRVTSLVSLMAALVTELNLSRASAVDERLTATFEHTKGSYGRANAKGVRTLMERRAYLGVFYVSSSTSTFFRDLSAIKRSSYQEDCCMAIEQAAEYPTDALLVSLTRLQIVVERIGHAFQYGTSNPSPRQAYRIPLPLYTYPLERDLEKFKKSLSPELQENSKPPLFIGNGTDFAMGIMMQQYHSVESYLYEFALYEPIQDSYFGQPSFRRMEYLYGCLQSLRAYYDSFFTTPANEFFHSSLISWVQITHATMTISKLCFLDAEDWNVSHVREVANFSELLEKVAVMFDEARALQNIQRDSDDEELDAFQRLAWRMRMVKNRYDQKVTAETSSSGQPVPTTFPIGPNQLMDSAAMDYISNLEGDAFWQEIMGGTWPMELNTVEG